MSTAERHGPLYTASYRKRRRFEWPTLVVAFFVYGGWASTVWWHHKLQDWMLFFLGAWFIAWHGSLQHELIHFPRKMRWLANLLGCVPLALYLPFEVYREEHLAHHVNAQLTDPKSDPESFYFSEVDWNRFGRLSRFLLMVNYTLAGRMLFGPAIYTVIFLRQQLKMGKLKIWIPHTLLAAGVGGFVVGISGMSLLEYLALFVYPGTSLLLLRSFFEHKWAESPFARTAIVEGKGLFSILYLNNNLHAVHHSDPSVPWYNLQYCYRNNRREILSKNHQFYFSSYWDLICQFFVKKNHTPIHPRKRDHTNLDA